MGPQISSCQIKIPNFETTNPHFKKQTKLFLVPIISADFDWLLCMARNESFIQLTYLTIQAANGYDNKRQK